jgi:hypothetical protein
LVLAAAGMSPPAGAAPVAGFNGGFDDWSGGEPKSWNASIPIVEETVRVVSGSAVSLTLGSATANIQHAALEIQAGDTVSGSVQLSGPSSAQARIDFLFLDESFDPITTTIGTFAFGTEGFSPATSQAIAPAGSAFLHFRITMIGSGQLFLDSATLDVQAAPPTAVPTDTPTPTATEAETASPTSTSGGGVESTPTRTATATKTADSTRTATPTREPTSTKTPTPRPVDNRSPTQPLPTSTPTLRPGSSSGGMLANGDFELVSEGKPAYWEKFGGTMLASGDAAGGSYAGCLESDTASTKWLYQVVPVEGGAWYAATAQGRSIGPAEAMIRVSWYASGDGSGSQLDQSESNITTSTSWTALSTGPIQAPADAQSARVRLVIRPGGNATACFDDAVFARSSAPAQTPVPPAVQTTAPNVPGSTSTPRATATSRPPGAASTSRTGSQTTVVPVQPLVSGPLALRISEFMSDPPPSGRDGDFEWVELVNIGDEPIDLAGWQLSDGNAAVPLGAVVVPAGGYVVVHGPGASLPGDVLKVEVDQIGNGLGNTGDLLRLSARGGEVVDEVSFGDNAKVFDPAPSAPDAGQALGVMDPAADPASENWAITLRPTPGEPNIFPPKPSATAGAARPGTPETTAQGPDDRPTLFVQDDEDSGGSTAPWIVLGGLAGISAGIAGAALWPRIKKLRERFRKG